MAKRTREQSETDAGKGIDELLKEIQDRLKGYTPERLAATASLGGADWGIVIKRVDNGFTITDNEGRVFVIEEREGDELSAREELLWEIIDFFDLRGDRYSKNCIAVVRVAGSKYEPKENENFVQVNGQYFVESKTI